MIMGTQRTRPIIRLAIVIAALAGLVYYYSPMRSRTGIMPYHAARDRTATIKMFRDNWYWLIADAGKNTNPEESPFSVEQYLDGGYIAKGEKRDETIAVYCIDNNMIGLVSYYSESFYKGILHFIVVDPAHRGRGYAEKLLRHALEDMKKRGLSLVQLLTRCDNIPAQKLYTKLGFKEFWRDNNFVKFEKELT